MGLVILAAFAVLAVGIFLIGEKNNLFSRKNQYFIEFNSVSGLQARQPGAAQRRRRRHGGPGRAAGEPARGAHPGLDQRRRAVRRAASAARSTPRRPGAPAGTPGSSRRASRPSASSATSSSSSPPARPGCRSIPDERRDPGRPADQRRRPARLGRGRDGQRGRDLGLAVHHPRPHGARRGPARRADQRLRVRPAPQGPRSSAPRSRWSASPTRSRPARARSAACSTTAPWPTSSPARSTASRACSPRPRAAPASSPALLNDPAMKTRFQDTLAHAQPGGAGSAGHLPADLETSDALLPRLVKDEEYGRAGDRQVQAIVDRLERGARRSSPRARARRRSCSTTPRSMTPSTTSSSASTSPGSCAG